MTLFIYAYENFYGGLHGMNDYGFFKIDKEKEAEEIALDLSCGVIEGYEDIERQLEEEADFYSDDRESDEWYTAYDDAVMQDTAYEIYALKDEIKEKSECELFELVAQEGVEGFIEKYCEEPKWE